MEKPKGYRVPSPKLDKQKEKGKLWQSPFLAKDRSKGMSSEALHLFEKFGMKLEEDDDEDEESEKSDVLTEISSQNNSYRTDENDVELEFKQNDDDSSESDNSPVTVVEIDEQFPKTVDTDSAADGTDYNSDIIESKLDVFDSPSPIRESEIEKVCSLKCNFI